MEKQGKKPEIRFPEFKKEWEHQPLHDLLEESKALNTDLQYDKTEVLSVSGELGCVNQIEHLGRSYAGESVHNYGVVETGDIVYTKSPLKANPFGIIKLNKGVSGIVSTLYAIYKPKKDKATGEFIDYYFSLNANTNRYLRPLVRKGAKNDMKINNSYVLHDKIFAPDIQEQIRICSFLTLIDKRLIQVKEKLTYLRKYKVAIMQQLFSQSQRFKDNNGDTFPDWEYEKLGKIAKKVNSKNKENKITHVLTNSANKGIISQGDYFDRDIANQNNLNGYYIVNLNDFVYNPRISTAAPVGPIKRNKHSIGVISPLYTVFTFHKGDLNFYEHYFNSTFWHRYMHSIANFGARFDRMNITGSDFFKMPIPYPCIEEQKKISNFISNIDNKIHTCQNQVVQIKEYKKSLLQKMFCV